MSLDIGDVVVVSNHSHKSREIEKITTGTIVHKQGKDIWVLLENGDIWVGSEHDVYEHQGLP